MTEKMHPHEKDKEFLKALMQFGGKANLTQIRYESALSNRDANHRFEKFEDEDIINVSPGRPEDAVGDREPPKRAHLTEEGCTAIQKGAYGVVSDDEDDGIPRVPAEEYAALKKQVGQLENTVSSLVEVVGRLDTNE